MQDKELTCARCFNPLDLPLYCKECKKWFCGRCWNLHDWEALPIPSVEGYPEMKNGYE